jgi:hypothetical protein
MRAEDDDHNQGRNGHRCFVEIAGKPDQHAANYSLPPSQVQRVSKDDPESYKEEDCLEDCLMYDVEMICPADRIKVTEAVNEQYGAE